MSSLDLLRGLWGDLVWEGGTVRMVTTERRARADEHAGEGFSPDPYLTGVFMSETIKGHQDVGVQACAKYEVLFNISKAITDY